MEFFFDFVSPYAYLASTRIDALAAEHGREVDWKPTLIGVTILKVMGMKPLMDTPLKSSYIAHDKPRMARLMGVPLVQRDMRGVNSVAALRAFLWLKQGDPQAARRFAREVFERLWVRGLDITQVEDVREACIATGVDADAVAAAIDTEAGKQLLRSAVDEAVAREVFGVPYVVIDGEPIWGVDRLWMVEHWLRHGSWEPVAR
ncbi:MAG: 2-hydroxychromene-2-carboxylate isomerase [Gammaproteobacteria bacterium]|nr:2-hydroxychromene-2-carboxylate isomerase [Gammaproteobacteria bacterium]MBU1441738.1 2-hydroxychromene-2-carboxylate isomerase [Gammaproteobacteria bacterium]MBU2288115.1 2-hydroxychromene-2-carboxylate isomerase [Gammaproteobacteria bacterium]